MRTKEQISADLIQSAITSVPEPVQTKIGRQAMREVCLAVTPYVLAAIKTEIVILANVLAREGPEAALKRIEEAGGRCSDLSLEALRGHMGTLGKVKRSSFLDALDELNYESK
jgi:hypothetical protein